MPPEDVICEYCLSPLLREYQVCPLCDNMQETERMKMQLEYLAKYVDLDDPDQLEDYLALPVSEGRMCRHCHRGKMPDEDCNCLPF